MVNHPNRKTAPEIIAECFCSDINDVKDGLYQSYRSPSVYVYGNDYYCCPTSSQRLPKDRDWNWTEIYMDRKTGRAVFESKVQKHK